MCERMVKSPASRHISCEVDKCKVACLENWTRSKDPLTNARIISAFDLLQQQWNNTVALWGRFHHVFSSFSWHHCSMWLMRLVFVASFYINFVLTKEKINLTQNCYCHGCFSLNCSNVSGFRRIDKKCDGSEEEEEDEKKKPNWNRVIVIFGLSRFGLFKPQQRCAQQSSIVYWNDFKCGNSWAISNHNDDTD